MQIAGIIAEYNPLHLGHQFHMEQTRKETGADYIITVLSGDFVQRGLPAVTDKHTRTRMALEAGSDLVLELPVPYALASGEGFAFGGISLLHQLGCVDYVSFGTEAGSLNALMELAKVLSKEDASYRTAYQAALKKGLTHPSARLLALKEAYPELDTTILDGHSNNMLAIEYCKALLSLNSSMQPFTIRRAGQSYLETGLTDTAFASATAIREALAQHKPDSLDKQLPKQVYQKLLASDAEHTLLFADDFSPLLHYRLLSLSAEELSDCWEVTPAFANKLFKYLTDFTSFSQFANLLWSKDTTYARVCRTLMHILLDIRQDTADVHAPVPYARILGFRKESAPLLSIIKEQSSIPLISKLADADKQLSGDALALLKLDMKAAHIYDSVRLHKSGQKAPHEMQKQIVLV